MSVVLLSTAPTAAVARSLANMLVEARLAACVNIVPGITSVYRWEGKVHADDEHLLVIKSQESRIPDITAKLKEHHPYDVPELISLPIQSGSSAYLAWLAAAVAPAPADH